MKIQTQATFGTRHRPKTKKTHNTEAGEKRSIVGIHRNVYCLLKTK